MASTALVVALLKVMDSGIWRSKKSLMSEVLEVYPDEFGHLTDRDAKEILKYANVTLLSAGSPMVYAEPSIDSDESLPMGRCVDLWEDSSPRKLFRSMAREKEFRRAIKFTMNTYRDE